MSEERSGLEDEKAQRFDLAWRDYLALLVASLETVGLPLLVLVAAFVLAAFLIRML